jgi:hypothetical protein
MSSSIFVGSVVKPALSSQRRRVFVLLSTQQQVALRSEAFQGVNLPIPSSSLIFERFPWRAHSGSKYNSLFRYFHFYVLKSVCRGRNCSASQAASLPL